MSIFVPKIFANPPRAYRPLKIVHGLDRYLGDEDVELADDDPAGQWNAWVAERDVNLTPGQLLGLRRYLETLSDQGLGGIVTNVGFQDYLESPKQWEILRQGLRIAQELGLRVWLYDEKGYPSGTAAGKVVRANPAFAALGLACYTLKITGPALLHFPMPVSCRTVVGAFATTEPERVTLNLGLDLAANFDDWQVLHWDVPAGEWTVLVFAERVMYEGTHSQGNVSEFKHYVNLLDPEVTKAFLRVTHEAYYRELPPDQWGIIEAIFTDEPSFMCYYVPALPERYQGKVPVGDAPRFSDRPMAVPWISGFGEIFREKKGYDLKPYYYALFYSQAEEACYVRQDYYEVLTDVYANAFYGQIQDWCADHGIASSGHLLLEENILDHVIFHGSMFDVIRRMDLPGLDMLSSNPEEMMHGGSFMGDSFMGVKQVSSVAHLSGHMRVHSESSDWEQRNQGGYASLKQRCGQANVQYALGVNQITSYFGWNELGADAQRHYNAYVGRLGALLTGGQHLCDVAVLYPVRTLWAHFVPPLEPIKSWIGRESRSHWETEVPGSYGAVVRELLCNQIDVDIIDEAALIKADIQHGALQINNEIFRVIVCPVMDAISLAAAQAIARFVESGGMVISVGDLPILGESEASTPGVRALMASLFAENGKGHQISLEHLVATIREYLPDAIKLRTPNPNVLVTHRFLEGRHVYFLANNNSAPVVLQPALDVPGPYSLYRPLTGEVTVLSMKADMVLELEAFEGVFLVSKAADPTD